MKYFTSDEVSKKTHGKIKRTNSFRKMIYVILAMTFIFSMTFPSMATQADDEAIYLFDEAVSDIESWYLFDETQTQETFETVRNRTVVLPAESSGERTDSVTVVFNNNRFEGLVIPENITVEPGGTFMLTYEQHVPVLDGFEFYGWFHPETVEVVFPGQEVTTSGSGIIELFAIFKKNDREKSPPSKNKKIS
ncbi:MAG: hypothetical protein FWD05_12115 [Oscillospiraceae bacterium]|nr:hypothetical protein [Oscillospiraceae bacterium]